MNPQLQEVVEIHKRLKAEADSGIIGLSDVKEKTEIAFWSEIPTTYANKKERRVNAGLVWYWGVPGVGKTYFGVVFSRATNTRFVRVQGRADLLPGEIVGGEVYNMKKGEFEIKPGPITNAQILLLDEGNRIPPKSQSAFLEANQDRTVTIGDTVIELPEFYFAIMTTNPLETGEGTYPVSDANADRFTFIIKVGYLSPDEEQKLVSFDIKNIDIKQVVSWEKVVELRSVIANEVQLGHQMEKYIRRLVRATRPYSSQNSKDAEYSPSSLVEDYVVLGASPRADICWGPTSKARALVVGKRDRVYPEDIQALAHNILGHRISLKNNAKSRGITVNQIIDDVIKKVPIP